MGYKLEISQDEINRLNMQFELINHPSLENSLEGKLDILDIGHGTGILQSLIKNEQANYLGIDINDYSQKARENSDFIVGDFFSYQFDKKFDFIHARLINWVFPEKIHDFMSKAINLLSPGGVLYSLEPNDSYLSASSDLKVLKKYIDHWKKETINIGSEVEKSLKNQSVGSLYKSITLDYKWDSMHPLKRENSCKNICKIMKDIYRDNSLDDQIIFSEESYIKEQYQINIYSL